jgi:hypothetical protein
LRHAIALLGWAALFVLAVAEVTLTGWAIFALLGSVPAPTAAGRAMTPADLASMAVAGATLILATVTVLLAVFTRRSLQQGRAELNLAEATLKTAQEQATRSAEQVAATLEQVKVTQEQADIARRTLETGWRPFLVDVPYGYAAPPGKTIGITDAAVVQAYKRENGSASVAVSLRNIGSGLAIITKAGLSFGQLHTTATNLSSSVVAVGEAVRITFEIEPKGAVLINMVSQIDSAQPFIVTATYTDQSGINNWRSRAYFRHPPQGGGRHEVEKVELFTGDADSPFAVSRPMDTG